MTDQIQQARRAAFEAWHMRKALEQAGREEYQSVFSWVTHKEILWVGFNAALDSISIELPDCTEFDFPSGAAPAIAECRAAIEQTNMGIKIK